MIVIGITGGIGSGKSTVSRYLKEKGFLVLDADEIAKNLFVKGNIVYETLLQKYGKDILDEEANIIREELGNIVFNNREELDFLNQLTHSKVEEHIVGVLKESIDEKVVFLDVPLLFEAGVDKYCDFVWMIFVEEGKKIHRTMARDNISEEKVRSIIANQMGEDEKAKKSDEVIDNNKGIEELLKNVDRILLKYEKRI